MIVGLSISEKDMKNIKRKQGNTMKEAYITFETAELAKEKGILLTDEMDCDGLFFEGRNDIYLPSQAVFARWLREKHGKNVYSIMSNKGKYIVWVQDIHSLFKVKTTDLYDSYEKALESGLQYALSLIK